MEVLEDVYVAVFATLLLGSMLVNVIVNVGRLSGEVCAANGCSEARSLLPWLAGVGLLALAVAGCRLFGPVFVTPAVDSWLATTPVDRGLLLRARLFKTLLAGVVGTALPAAAAAAVAGFGWPAVAAVGLLVGLGTAAVVGLAAVLQGGTRDVRPLGWVLGIALWAGLLSLPTGHAPLWDAPDSLGIVGWSAVVAVGCAAGAVAFLAVRRLGRLRRRDVAPGGSLAPSMSGALASLDLALLYDVLLAHRWRRHEAVRPRRGGPTGLAALVWTDLVRLRRSPRSVIGLAATVVVPYAAQTSGAGRLTVVLAAVAGFLGLLPLLTGVRVLTRTPGLVRLTPFPVSTARIGLLVVPGAMSVVVGLAGAPAIDRALEAPPGVGWPVGLAVGLAILTAGTRWVTGRPPDYSRPLVSTPAGAVPTNLYGSVVRGFDMVLLTTAPILLSPTVTGAWISIALSIIVLGYLTGRE